MKFNQPLGTCMVDFQSLEPNPQFPQIEDVTPEELADKQHLIQLIDVRSPEEYHAELGHIPGSWLIPLNVLEASLETIPRDKDVIFVCRSGNRSAKAAALAKKCGYEKVFNLKGGMLRWNELKMKVEYGSS